jgi:BASS family bile acid:Na+ symporter
MSEIIQFLDVIFKPTVFVFTVSSLFAMGLQVKIPEVMAALKNKKAIVLIFVWAWVLAPAVGYLIIWVLPLAEPYVIVVLLSSLAPAAPIVPLMVQRARGDLSFAGVLIPVVMIGAVVLIPLIGPLMVKGLTVSAADLAKPLFVQIFLPLIIGAAARHYVETMATKIFPAVNVLARVVTLVMIVVAFVLFAKPMFETFGSLALLAATIHVVGMMLITYVFGFGLKQNQRSVMALGNGTRNLAAILAAAFAIPNVDPRIPTFVIMWGLWSFVLAAVGAKIFAKQAGETVAGLGKTIVDRRDRDSI